MLKNYVGRKYATLEAAGPDGEAIRLTPNQEFLADHEQAQIKKALRLKVIEEVPEEGEQP